MRLYDQWVLPRVIGVVCASPALMRERARVVPLAQGRVLDLGTGSGINLPLYDPARVTEVVAVEPSPDMRRVATANLDRARVPVQWVEAPAEALPLPDASVDEVVLTCTLCTVTDPVRALAEVRRVLKPGGRVRYLEHGASPDAGVFRWQGRLTPVWSTFAGGCTLDRDTHALLAAAGFDVVEEDASYLPGTPRVVGYTRRGVAVRRA